jgi:hypothetical protein
MSEINMDVTVAKISELDGGRWLFFPIWIHHIIYTIYQIIFNISHTELSVTQRVIVSRLVGQDVRIFQFPPAQKMIQKVVLFTMTLLVATAARNISLPTVFAVGIYLLRILPFP